MEQVPVDRMREPRITPIRHAAAVLAAVVACGTLTPPDPSLAAEAPRPLLAKEQPVDWWFVFKFNASKTFAGCGKVDEGEKRTCIFGGKVQARAAFGQQFAVASSRHPKLTEGHGCLGATLTDPVGATFDQVYNGRYFYLIWNDQFYRDPAVRACKGDSCGAPWGHSKGLLAWNEAGEGFIMQVSTPAWPRSGSKRFDDRRRNAGNTLGCISSNNNLRASQHFFALKLDKSGLLKVLDGLQNAGVVTDPDQLQLVHNGGPAEIQDRVLALGQRPDRKKTSVMMTDLSRDVILISKPPALHAPPWQIVSALLQNADERAATWWTKPWINTTTKSTRLRCWDKDQLGERAGPVTIVGTGDWKDQELNLTAPSNHAKIGIAIAGDKRYSIFGDLNQQGAIQPPDCNRSQNGRGGLFFAVRQSQLFDSIADLIGGDPAPKKP